METFKGKHLARIASVLLTFVLLVSFFANVRTVKAETIIETTTVTTKENVETESTSLDQLIETSVSSEEIIGFTDELEIAQEIPKNSDLEADEVVLTESKSDEPETAKADFSDSLVTEFDVSDASTAEVLEETNSESNNLESQETLEETKDSGNSEKEARAGASDFQISNGVLLKYLGNDKIVNVPANVVEIGANAFSSVNTLEQVNLPPSVTVIGDSAFSNCYNLTKINLENVHVINAGAFAFTALSSITLTNCTFIGFIAFSSNSLLTQVILGENLKEMHNFAFADCQALSAISIPGSLSELSLGIFNNCSNLKTVTLNEGLTTIYGDNNFVEGVFSNCTSLKTINLPTSLRLIGANAFRNSGLVEINIPSGVEWIWEDAFADTKNLIKVTIPPNVTTIASSAFRNSKPKVIGQVNTRAESYAKENGLVFIAYGTKPGPVTSLRASLRAKGSIQLNWDAATNAAGYIVYRKIGSNPYVYRSIVSGTSFIDNGLTSSELHYYRVYPYNLKLDGSRIVGDSTSYASKYANLKPLQNLRVGINKSGTLTTLWDSVPGADGYIIYRKQGGEALKYHYIVSNNFYIDALANFPVPYVYIVYPYQLTNTGKRVLGPSHNYVYAIPRPTVVTKLKVSTLGRANTISWSAVPGATGYIVYRRAPGQSTFNYLYITSNIGYKDTVTRAGTYFYRVYPYRMIDGKRVVGTANTYVYAINK